MRRIALFARPPLPGRAKTRLTPSLPPALAAAVAAALVEDAAHAVAGAGADDASVWWAEPPGASGVAGLRAHLQEGGELGERLAHAFASLLRSGDDRVLVVGSDTPALQPAQVAEALAQLESHDAVLGPALDGGYWCVGLRRTAPALFRDIPWSTGAVLETTLGRAREAGLSVGLAATLGDLDMPADLARTLGDAARGHRACGPALRDALRRMSLTPAWLDAR